MTADWILPDPQIANRGIIVDSTSCSPLDLTELFLLRLGEDPGEESFRMAYKDLP
jgi:hypothetical protein